MEKKIKAMTNSVISQEREGWNSEKPTAVIFDFDGLLVDTETCMFRAWEALMKPYGAEVSCIQIAGLVGNTEPATFLYDQYRNASGMDKTDQYIRNQVLKLAYEFIEAISERDGVKQYLDYALEHSMKIGLATSSEYDHYMPILKRLKLDHYFDCFIGEEQVIATRRKPYPDVYLLALQHLGVSAHQAIAFEDSPPGIQAARSAGIPTVVVTNTLTRHLDVSQANIILSSMSEKSLPQLINQLTEISL